MAAETMALPLEEEIHGYKRFLTGASQRHYLLVPKFTSACFSNNAATANVADALRTLHPGGFINIPPHDVFTWLERLIHQKFPSTVNVFLRTPYGVS